MVTFGINPEVTVTMMSIAVTVPDIRLKTPDGLCDMPILTNLKRSELHLKWHFSSRDGKLVFIPASTL